MMKEINFCKMVASGNDFVVVDRRKNSVTDAPRLARELCDRHFGIGADGLLLLEKKGDRSRYRGTKDLSPLDASGDFRVRIFNSDGSEAEACGNGFRCIALFAAQKLGLPKKQRFESISGMIDSEVNGKRIRVRLADPKEVRGPEKIKVMGREIHYHFVNTGVPHAVIFVEGIEKIPVFEMGREIRFHPSFKPAGTNVNFVEVTGPQAVSVRTYERGVEEETLACGTGTAASALVSAKLGHVKPPVRVKTSGGEFLTIDFSKKGNQFRGVFLEGEARFVFEGTWKGRE